MPYFHLMSKLYYFAPFFTWFHFITVSCEYYKVNTLTIDIISLFQIWICETLMSMYSTFHFECSIIFH